MTPRHHPLFQHYPLTSIATISIGAVPTPYHIYDGYGLFIGGTCDGESAKRLLKEEALTPIQTSEGRAIMGIWICNFVDASLGPHHELQFSFFVSEKDAPPIAPHPLNTLSLMLTRPDVRMLCYGLWNSTAKVVAYNRELLSLNARQTDSRIDREARALRFQFNDTLTGQAILSGAIHNPAQSSLPVMLALMARLGWQGTMKVAQQPWISMKILNPVGVALNRHATAEAFTKNEVNVVRYFDPRADQLEFGDTAYRALGFTPQCVQYMDGFKFVYLHSK